jgi:predicted secreted hydrolase
VQALQAALHLLVRSSAPLVAKAVIVVQVKAVAVAAAYQQDRQLLAEQGTVLCIKAEMAMALSL